MLANKILDAARCPHTVGFGDYENVFTVGPFARRVSFEHQQRRALNLAWALAEVEKRDWSQVLVAIVGASLSGLMTAAALASLGATVHLIERRPGPLGLFSDARHRRVHPTVNQWPDIPYECTTTLPFMNWYEEACSNVAEQVRVDWQKIEGHDAVAVLKKFNHKVLDIHHDSRFGQERYALKSIWCNPIKPDESDSSIGDNDECVWFPGGTPAETSPQQFYDIVVFATGFGTERDLSGSDLPGYWQHEHFDEIRTSKRHQTLLVSGAGDGALADIARFFFDTRSEQYNDLLWRLATSNGLAATAREAENEAYKQAKNPLDGYIESDDAYRQALDEACKALETFYRDRAREVIPDRLMGELNALALVNPENRAVIIGQEAAPFSPFAAPMLKLLLGFLMGRRGESFMASYHSVGESCSINRSDETVTYDNGLTIRGDAIVVRHGPQLEALSGILKDPSKVKALRNKQRRLWDVAQLGEVDHWQFARRLNRPTLPEDPRQFANTHLGKASDRLRAFIGDDARRCTLDESTEGVVYAIPAPKPSGRPTPEKLFGIQVVYGAASEPHYNEKSLFTGFKNNKDGPPEMV